MQFDRNDGEHVITQRFMFTGNCLFGGGGAVWRQILVSMVVTDFFVFSSVCLVRRCWPRRPHTDQGPHEKEGPSVRPESQSAQSLHGFSHLCFIFYSSLWRFSPRPCLGWEQRYDLRGLNFPAVILRFSPFWVFFSCFLQSSANASQVSQSLQQVGHPVAKRAQQGRALKTLQLRSYMLTETGQFLTNPKTFCSASPVLKSETWIPSIKEVSRTFLHLRCISKTCHLLLS